MPIEKKKEYRHGDLRKAALEAAVALIQERGDASFGLRDLAARVGVSHPALYRHFADRAALFSAIAAEGFALYGATQKVALKGAPKSPSERLVILGLNHLRFALSHPSYFRVMFGAKIVEHKMDDAALAQVATPTFNIIVETAAALNGDNPLDFALMLWASVHGIAFLSIDAQLAHWGKSKQEDLENLVEQSVRYLIKGYPQK
jgi:AcrR family transcriptional regulator